MPVFLDEKGRLTVIDRVKDLATTSNGVNFSPQFIENKLKFSPYIGECVVLGNGHEMVTAILCIRYSMVSKWAEAKGLGFTTYTNLSALPEVYALIQGEVDKVNATLPPAQRIARFLLLYKELDADDGELTRTRKVRRSVIDERYAPIIEALYGGQDRVVMETEVTFEDGRTGQIRADMTIVATGDGVDQMAAGIGSGMATAAPSKAADAPRKDEVQVQPDLAEVLLAVEGVTLRFGGVTALTDVSFDIRRGEVRAIIGPKWCGQVVDAERDQRLLSSAGRPGDLERRHPQPDAPA